MTTSGSTDFELTRNEIIELAYGKIGGLSDGDSLSAEQYSTASKWLNVIVKNWTAEDIYLWKVDWITQGLTASGAVLGSDGYDYECIRNHTSSASNKPVTGAEYMSYWKKLTTSAASAWVTDTAYTSICNISLNSNIISLENVRVREGVSNTILKPLSREDFLGLGNNTEKGKPTQFFFKKQVTSEMFLYPYPDSATSYVIEMMAYRYAEDLDTGANTADYLVEWERPLIDELAATLAPSRGIFGDQLTALTIRARTSKKIARGSNHERGDVFFTPRLK